MIKLYQFPSLWSLPNASPFCMKLETYLRMAKLPFEIVPVANPQKSPKGKLPVISDNGRKIADSGFIIEYLQQHYDISLDAHLTEEQKASALALKRMLEEHLYWILIYSRWVDYHYWPITQEAFFGHLKKPLSYFIPKLVRKKMVRDLYHQGIGRHNATEIYQLGVEDLHVLSVFLAKNNFCFGDEPTSIDACIYAFLANILYSPIPSPLQEYAQTQPHFIIYCEQMRELFYS